MTRSLRVAAVQLRCGIDSAANRAHAAALLQDAARDGAQLIATPENTVRLDRDRARLLTAAQSPANATEIAAWAEQAATLGVWLLIGSGSFAATDDRVFNRSLLFAPDGTLAAHYDKIHMFDVQLAGGESYRESQTVAPGNQAVLATGPDGVKLGMTICYDLRFPALYSALARAGAEVISIPSSFTQTTGIAHWETLLRARAIETGAFIIAPAQGGRHEDGRDTWGHSMIVDPWGAIVAQLDHQEPGYLIADLDLERVAQARASIPAWSGGPSFALP